MLKLFRARSLLTSIESGNGKIIIGDNIELDYCASLTRDLLDRADQLEFESKTEAAAKIETESKKLTTQQAMDPLNLASKVRDLAANIEVRYFAQSDMRFVYDASKVSVNAVERSFLVTPGTGEIVKFANDDELKKSAATNKKISTDLRACISEFTSRETDEKLTEIAVHFQSGAVQKKRAFLNFQSYLVFAREMIKQYPNLRVLGDVNFDIANLAVLMQLPEELAKINKDRETAGLPAISMAIPKDLAIKEREVSAFNAQIAKVNGGPPTVSDSMLILFSGNLSSESSYILTAELDDQARKVSEQYFSCLTCDSTAQQVREAVDNALNSQLNKSDLVVLIALGRRLNELDSTAIYQFDEEGDVADYHLYFKYEDVANTADEHCDGATAVVAKLHELRQAVFSGKRIYNPKDGLITDHATVGIVDHNPDGGFSTFCTNDGDPGGWKGITDLHQWLDQFSDLKAVLEPFVKPGFDIDRVLYDTLKHAAVVDFTDLPYDFVDYFGLSHFDNRDSDRGDLN